jgi:hypothetical protein
MGWLGSSQPPTPVKICQANSAPSAPLRRGFIFGQPSYKKGLGFRWYPAAGQRTAMTARLLPKTERLAGTRGAPQALCWRPSRPEFGREAYHATKGVLAGLRCRSARSADCRTRHDWAAHIEHLTPSSKPETAPTLLPPSNNGGREPRHTLALVAGFLLEHSERGKRKIRQSGRTPGPSCVSPAPQLKREWSPWPEVGRIPSNLCDFSKG